MFKFSELLVEILIGEGNFWGKQHLQFLLFLSRFQLQKIFFPLKFSELALFSSLNAMTSRKDETSSCLNQ
jgi:hypothetical protein